MNATCVLVLVVFSAVADANKISEANNRFAPDVYKEIVKSGTGNIFFSPLSVETVLCLLHAGTEGDTAQELAKALYLPDDKEEIRNETKNLLTELQSSEIATFEIANGLFIQEGLDVKQSFVKIATEDFYATSQNVNFGKTKEAADVINKYVEDHTNKTIKDLVSPDDLPGTVMVLVNALRLKADWLAQFSQKKTKQEEFFVSSGNSINVEFLHVTHTFNYYESHTLEAEFLEMPFKEQDASLVIVLPRDHNGLPVLEERIDEVFASVPFEPTDLNLAVPKFKFEYKIDFKTILEALGVTKIFSSAADLSGIAGGKGDLAVTQVVQKAFIDLNEGGVEAAAATFVGIGRSAGVHADRDFRADRPFVFFIRCKGVVVFVGKVVEPKY